MVLSTLIDILMAVLPPAAYIQQYLSIRKTRNASGFSTLVSFILIISGILRIFFWFGKRFSYSLLFQAILMVIFQIKLLDLCVKVENPNVSWKLPSLSKIFSARSFWKWNHIFDYMYFLIIFISFLSLSSMILGNNEFYIEIIGFISLLIEAMLGVPQAIKIYKRKSSEGLSSILILSWIIGDILKTIFYIYKESPIQFTFCGIFQIIVDIIIIFQIFIYGQ